MPYLEKYPAVACRGFFDAEGWVEDICYQVVAGNTDPRYYQHIRETSRKAQHRLQDISVPPERIHDKPKKR